MGCKVKYLTRTVLKILKGIRFNRLMCSISQYVLNLQTDVYTLDFPKLCCTTNIHFRLDLSRWWKCNYDINIFLL